jgi:soluble lytic murein transglycosylase
LGRTLSASEIATLGAYLTEIDEPYYTLLLGKAAVERGILIPSVYYPIHDMAALDLPAEPALALSIARRESEFNETIGSPVGALGLMQVMPATAEEVSGSLGMPYSRGQLTNDWRYNATIGANYLAFLEEEFGPTPVMIAAGYNAGPSRPRQWMDERGDPRLLEMDVVDWIEHIPFRETRNYVMRVTESIPVYQARLTGQTGPVRFTELLIGKKPLLRPRARPERVASDAPSDVVRPVARP